MTPFITFQGQFGYQFQKKETKKAYLKTGIFLTVAKCCAGGYEHFQAITRCQATPVQLSILERKSKGEEPKGITFRTRR